MKIEMEIPELLVPIVYEILKTDVPDDDDGATDAYIMRRTGASVGEFVQADHLATVLLELLDAARKNAMIARELVGIGPQKSW